MTKKVKKVIKKKRTAKAKKKEVKRVAKKTVETKPEIDMVEFKSHIREEYLNDIYDSHNHMIYDSILDMLDQYNEDTREEAISLNEVIDLIEMAIFDEEEECECEEDLTKDEDYDNEDDCEGCPSYELCRNAEEAEEEYDFEESKLLFDDSCLDEGEEAEEQLYLPLSNEELGYTQMDGFLYRDDTK